MMSCCVIGWMIGYAAAIQMLTAVGQMSCQKLGVRIWVPVLC
jgi:hypothetical protein